MQQVTFAGGELTVGALAYGCWRMAEGDACAALKNLETALEAGMTLIDTADIYGYGTPAGFGGAEVMLGRILQESPALREEMVLVTKGGVDLPTPYNASREYLISACEASLKRLQTDVIDLYLVHRPDLLAPVEGTADALQQLVTSGKVRHVGVSNYTSAQFQALQAHLDIPLVCHQPEFSAWQIDPITDGTLDQCQETGAACLAWSPLAGGRLVTGRQNTTDTPERFADVINTLDRLAAKYDCSRTGVALAFLLTHPARVIPIIGTQTPARIIEAVGAAHISLEPRDWYDLYEARRGLPMP